MRRNIVYCLVYLLGDSNVAWSESAIIQLPDFIVRMSVAPQRTTLSSQFSSRMTYTINAENIGKPNPVHGVKLRFYPFYPSPVELPIIDSGGDFFCQAVGTGTPGLADARWYV